MVNAKECNKQVYKHGIHVFTLASVKPEIINNWVDKLSQESGQKVDWHFVGGRACIKCIGKIDLVIRAIENNLAEISSKTNYWRFTTEDDLVLPIPLN